MDKNLHNHGGLTLTNNSTKLLKQIKLANIKIYKTQSVCHFNQNVGKHCFQIEKNVIKLKKLYVNFLLLIKPYFFDSPGI